MTKIQGGKSEIFVNLEVKEDSHNEKKNFIAAKFRGLKCAAPPQVSVPAVIRLLANWEAKKVRKKKQRSTKNKIPNQDLDSVSSSCGCLFLCSDA
ncbi:hypothetical protein LguiB_006149 [Lonicera macranthoides]